MGDHAAGTAAEDQLHDLADLEICNSDRSEFYPDSALYCCRAAAARNPRTISAVYLIPLAGFGRRGVVGRDAVELRSARRRRWNYPFVAGARAPVDPMRLQCFFIRQFAASRSAGPGLQQAENTGNSPDHAITLGLRRIDRPPSEWV